MEDFAYHITSIIQDDKEIDAIICLIDSLKNKNEQMQKELDEKNATIRVARKLNSARIKDEALFALFDE